MTTSESAPDPTAGERECRYPCDCGQFPEEHCACMDGHATPDADDASTDASEPLTEAEREALWSGLRRARHEDAPVPLAHEFHKVHVLWAVTPAVERIVVAREAAAATKARADERERIAQAIEAASKKARGHDDWIDPDTARAAARIARGDA